MPSPRSHSLSELVDLSGFERRTIVYYIQSGLLPRVGRRGPHTRYPDECLTRLRFIKGVKDLQTSGRLLTATLAEIGRALASLDDEGIREVMDRGLPAAEVEALFAGPTTWPLTPETSSTAVATPGPVERDPSTAASAAREPTGDRRSYGLADASIRQRFGTERPAGTVTRPGEVSPLAASPAEFSATSAGATALAAPSGAGNEGADLGQLLRELELRPTLNARRSPPGAPEQWTEIPVTSRVYLSVRGLAESDAPLAEAVARLLKRALRTR